MNLKKARLIERDRKTITSPFPEEHRNKVVVVDVSNVAEWYFVESEIDEFELQETFPCIISPFQYCVFDYLEPARWKLKGEDGKWAVDDSAAFKKKTWNRHCAAVWQVRLEEGYAGSSPQEGEILSGLKSGAKNWSEPRFRQHVRMSAGSDGPIHNMVDFLVYADVNGAPLGAYVLKSSSFFDEVDYPPLNFIRCFTFPIYFGISMLHCKNIELKDSEHAERYQRQFRRNGLNPHTVKTIVIDPMKKRVPRESSAGSKRILTVLDIVRGHMKDYTKGKGLFGKYHGRFWWADQVKTETVDKEYVVRV